MFKRIHAGSGSCAPAMMLRRFHTGIPRAKNSVLRSIFGKPKPQPPQPPDTGLTAPELSDEIPPPKRPNRMVEVQREQKGIRKLLSKIFNTDNTSERAARQYRQEKLTNIGLNKTVKFLNTDKVTNILYWYCIDLTFLHADFARLLPDKSLRVGSHDPKFDHIDFTMTRARNPVNLTKWMGYFLTFESKEAAMVYYQETLGAELCGMPLKLKFVPDTIRGLNSPLLEKTPDITRHCHALLLGLPVGYSETQILRVLWDYDLVDDDSAAVERLPVDKVKYGASPFLLRFKNEDEAERFVRDYNHATFPYTENKVFCEVID